MHTVFMAVAKAMAYLGGLMLVALVFLTCFSVAGRELNDIAHTWIDVGLLPGFARWVLDLGVGPINGDFELIEAGIAFAIFAFIPLCQITGGHASVEIFTAYLPQRVNRILGAVIEVVFALVLVLIAVQLFSGMLSKVRTGQTTLLLEFPVWWAYALSVVGAFFASVLGVYMAVQRVREAVLDTDIIPASAGAEH